MTVLVPMREALADPHLLGNAMPGETWAGWRALLIAAMGEPLTDEERAIFTRLTGRDSEPLERVEELWAIVGRRGGKTRSAAVLAVYFGALVDHSSKLAIGERGIIPFMSASVKQAEKAFAYAVGLFEAVPILSGLVTNKTADTLSLSTRVDLEIRPASWRTSRGDTAVAAIGDEAAFWRSDDSANPDTEILNALRPALATTGGPLIVISTPYARRGELYTTWKKHFGTKGDPLILVAQAASRELNPSLSQKVVDRAIARDAAAAGAEWLAQFRSDVEALFTQEAVDAAIDDGVIERPWDSRQRYMGFVDPSGGSNDSMTLAVAHREGQSSILDLVREVRAPFNPDLVTKEFADTLKLYGIGSVTGDRYGGEWPRERFKAHGIYYELAESTRSELYLALLPAVNSGRVALLDVPRLKNQLIALERRTARGGRDSVDHPPGDHDDVANAAAGAIGMVLAKKLPMVISNAILRRAAVPPSTQNRAFFGSSNQR